MKRYLAIVLSLIILASSLCGCSVYYQLFGYDEDYTGNTYYMYFGDEPTTLDPMYAYLDDSAAFVMSMIYEGLYKYDENGKVVNALAESYKKTRWDTTEGNFQIEITIKKTCWNDQVTVQASQFIDAWRRILSPDSDSPAAVLLYDIKNAKEVKNAEGDLTKFDFGADAVGTRVLRIDLVGSKNEDGTYTEPDLDAFFEKLASPMLVPVRREAIAKLTDWATSNATVPANGPFYLKVYNVNEDLKNGKKMEIRLQRNRYYLRDEECDPIDTYVDPYCIVIYYSVDTELERNEKGDVVNSTTYYDSAAEQAVAYYKAGNLDYLSYLPLSARAEYKDEATVADSLFTHTYYFNTELDLFKDAKVRQALSLAVDRTALSNELVFAKPATSIVNPLAFETGYAKKNVKYFTDNLTRSGKATDISVNANMTEAKKLLAEAGVSGGSFEITVKAGDEAAVASAEFCKKAWEELGFTVGVRKLGTQVYSENDYDGLLDLHAECFKANGKTFETKNSDGTIIVNKGFDVIAVETYMNSTDPFTVLAPFAKGYTGGFLDLSVSKDVYDLPLPIGNYSNERYDKLIDEAYNATSREEKAAKLHEAEQLLMEDLPVMPLYITQTSTLKRSELKDIENGMASIPDFRELDCKNYVERDEDEMMADTWSKYDKKKKN